MPSQISRSPISAGSPSCDSAASVGRIQLRAGVESCEWPSKRGIRRLGGFGEERGRWRIVLNMELKRAATLLLGAIHRGIRMLH